MLNISTPIKYRNSWRYFQIIQSLNVINSNQHYCIGKIKMYSTFHIDQIKWYIKNPVWSNCHGFYRQNIQHTDIPWIRLFIFIMYDAFSIHMNEWFICHSYSWCMMHFPFIFIRMNDSFVIHIHMNECMVHFQFIFTQMNDLFFIHIHTNE